MQADTIIRKCQLRWGIVQSQIRVVEKYRVIQRPAQESALCPSEARFNLIRVRDDIPKLDLARLRAELLDTE